MMEVIPQVFIGNTEDAHSFNVLKRKNVRLIINAARDHPCPFKDSFEYIEFPLLDDESDNVLLYVDEAFQHIWRLTSSHGSVLVHCVQGVSRSVAIVTAYVMKRDKISFTEAYKRVMLAYPNANISDHFARQLTDYGAIFSWDMSLNSQHHRIFRMKNSIVSEYSRDVESVTSRFLCRKCRHSVFTNNQIIPDNGSNYRIECMQWMEEQVGAVSKGPLCCPGCSGKLGEFNWMGLISEHDIPAFIITRSKVDEMPLTSKFKGDAFPKTRY